MKKNLLLLLIAFTGTALFAQNIDVTITITGLTPNSGELYINVQNEEEFSEKEYCATCTDVVTVTESTIVHTISVPKDYYYIAVFQDTNSNKKLDTKIFGIPKEPVGISNYNFDGIPGGFDKHKVLINETNTSVIVKVQKF